MFNDLRTYFFMAAMLPGVVSAYGQQVGPVSRPVLRSIHLNVAVEEKNGQPITGLQAQDFTVLDNQAARPVTSFKAVSAGQEPVQVILLIDAVNTRFNTVALERDQLRHFLKANDGHLAVPTTLAVLTDKGVQMQNGFSTDGNALSDALDHTEIGLRSISRASGIWGADERTQISLKALEQLSTYAETLPGRKVILWLSPGWPLLTGVRIDLDAKQHLQIFGNIVAFSTQMREANVTLYNVNPIGPGENLIRADYYKEYTKGIAKPGKTDLADVSLQVLAEQSGGLVMQSSNDVAGMLTRCLKDVASWYEIEFDMAVAEQPNEYHHVEVKVNKPGVSARTRDGYYAQP